MYVIELGKVKEERKSTTTNMRPRAQAHRNGDRPLITTSTPAPHAHCKLKG
jgi:hypothetical protein